MARGGHTPVTVAEKEQFLDALAAGKSAKAAAGSEAFRRKLYRVRTKDPDFDAAWTGAHVEGGDALVDVAWERAVNGWDEPVWHKGEQVGTIRKFDNVLLMFLIKQRDPSYRENRTVELTGKDGGAVQVEVKEARERLATRLAGISDRRAKT